MFSEPWLLKIVTPWILLKSLVLNVIIPLFCQMIEWNVWLRFLIVLDIKCLVIWMTNWLVWDVVLVTTWRKKLISAIKETSRIVWFMKMNQMFAWFVKINSSWTMVSVINMMLFPIAKFIIKNWKMFVLIVTMNLSNLNPEQNVLILLKWPIVPSIWLQLFVPNA